MMRRHYCQNEAATFQRRCERVGSLDAVGNFETGEKQIVGLTGLNRVAHLTLVSPKADRMASAPREHDRESRSPRSPADYCDTAHARMLNACRIRSCGIGADFPCRSIAAGCWLCA